MDGYYISEKKDFGVALEIIIIINRIVKIIVTVMVSRNKVSASQHCMVCILADEKSTS